MTQLLVLPVPPSVNKYWLPRRGGRGVYLSKDGNLFRARVSSICAALGVRPETGPVVAYMTVFRGRKVGDLDNFEKALWDALQGCAYINDSQIREKCCRLDDDKDNPRCEVVVLPLCLTEEEPQKPRKALRAGVPASMVVSTKTAGTFWQVSGACDPATCDDPSCRRHWQ